MKTPSISKMAWIDAMAKVQGEVKSVMATRKNDQTRSTYADLDDVLEMARPIWSEHGFSLTFTETDKVPIQGTMTLLLHVEHKYGWCKTLKLRIPYDAAGMKGNANKTPIQAMGSSITYGRRYLTSMALGISVDHDDDGNTDASGGGSKEGKPADEGLVKAVKDLLNELDISEEDFLAGISEKYGRAIEALEDMLSAEASEQMRNLRKHKTDMKKQEQAAEKEQASED